MHERYIMCVVSQTHGIFPDDKDYVMDSKQFELYGHAMEVFPMFSDS